MRRSDFDFPLPPELIAQRPAESRGGSRLLCVDTAADTRRDRRFTDLPELVRPGDLLIFNDTRVIRARLMGRKASGGRCELLLERILDDSTALVQLRASKPPAAGGRLKFDAGFAAEVLGRVPPFFRVRFLTELPLLELFERHGQAPLPPYIERQDDADDADRYQTVYARAPGSVAAPTAGLHFDESMLELLRSRGVETAFVTLHVGSGTFMPVREDDLSLHTMHEERYQISASTVDALIQCRARKGRVIAVGTTSVRTLESAAAQAGGLQAGSGQTRLFITPGFRFRVVDALITNFHLPQSTLLMLVSAFGGYERMMAAYRHAVAERYRFFSYGDAMYIAPCVSRDADDPAQSGR